MFKQITLLLITNLLIIVMLGTVLSLLGIRTYLTAYGIDYQALMVISLIWGMGGAFISLWMSKFMVKWLLGVKIISRHSPAHLIKLQDKVRYYAKKAGLKFMPEVGIYPSAEVNAFATGPSKNRALVAFSSGLLEEMDDEALSGVIAHEIAHVANNDMVTMTLIQGVMNAFVIFISRVLAYFAAMFFSRDDEGPSYLIQVLLALVFDIIFGLLASIVVYMYSRRREYVADASGARYASKQTMIHALESLKATVDRVHVKGNHATVNTFKIAGKQSFLQLFASHPPLESRIQALKNNM